MLFVPSELQSEKIVDDAKQRNDNVAISTKEQSKTNVYSIAEKCDLSKYITSFENDIEVISKGAFSMHQLVKYIVSILPQPCNIYATTWATSETVVSTLISMKEQQMINHCFFLFDHRVLKYRPNAYILFEKNFKCKILSIHAKICVIESENISIRIVGSGNWTRNDKVEVYSISSNANICNYYKDYIINELAT
jgi:hypothetical protein